MNMSAVINYRERPECDIVIQDYTSSFDTVVLLRTGYFLRDSLNSVRAAFWQYFFDYSVRSTAECHSTADIEISLYHDALYETYLSTIESVSKRYAASYPHWEQFPPELLQKLVLLEERAYNYFQLCVEAKAEFDNEKFFFGQPLVSFFKSYDIPTNPEDSRILSSYKSAPASWEQVDQFFAKLVSSYDSALKVDFAAAERAYQLQERLASFDSGVDITDDGVVTGLPFDSLYTDHVLGRVYREFSRSVRDTFDYYPISFSPFYRAFEAYWAFVQDFYVFKAIYAFRAGVWHIYPVLAFVFECSVGIFLVLFFFRHTFGLLRLETWYYRFLIKNNLTLFFIPGVLVNQVFVFFGRWRIRFKLFAQRFIAKVRPFYRNRKFYSKRVRGWLLDRKDRVIAIYYETKFNFLENLKKARTKAEEATDRWVYKSVLDCLEQKQNRVVEKVRELGAYDVKLYEYMHSKDPENYPIIPPGGIPRSGVSGKPLRQRVPLRSQPRNNGDYYKRT